MSQTLWFIISWAAELLRKLCGSGGKQRILDNPDVLSHYTVEFDNGKQTTFYHTRDGGIYSVQDGYEHLSSLYV